jgi:hypothetical protein
LSHSVFFEIRSFKATFVDSLKESTPVVIEFTGILALMGTAFGLLSNSFNIESAQFINLYCQDMPGIFDHKEIIAIAGSK